MEFFNYKTKLLPQKGRILLSEPHLPDPNFERSIVLLCEHNEEGSLGFIINKPASSNLSDLLDDTVSFDFPVFIGGPVEQNTLHFVHKYGGLAGATEVCDGVFWGGDFEKLIFLMETKQLLEEDIKFFLGYSGWAVNQLNEELEIDSWIVSDRIDGQLLFETDSNIMWQKALQSMGGRFSVYSNYPKDPRLN
jgi:putative transcriptional regulator